MYEIQIPYPDNKPKLRTSSTGNEVFCIIRKKWLKSTPEEWVRQNFLLYLLEVLHYPASLIAVEKMIELGELTKRFDILVYNQQHQPHIIVECKSMQIPLNEEVLNQALRYYTVVQTKYVAITNGPSSFLFFREGNSLIPANHIPAFNSL